MQALAAGRLAKGFQACGLQPIPDFEGTGDDGVEIHVGRGIQIEDQTPSDLRIAGRAIPGMDFQGAYLSGGGQRLHAIDLHIGRLVTPDFYRGDQVRHAGDGVALKELLGPHAVRQTHERTGSSGQMRQQPLAHAFVVARELGFGHGRAIAGIGVAGVGPEHLVGM